MTLAIIKILTIPILLWLVYEIARRFGPLVGGVVNGLPLISGPITFYVALEQGVDFAQKTALGAYPGQVTFVVFGLCYCYLGKRWHWATTVLTTLLVYAIVALLMGNVTLPVGVWPVVGAIAILIGLKLIPAPLPDGRQMPTGQKSRPYLQMVCGATLMFIITSLATVVGPTFSGVLMFFPVIGGILGMFMLKAGFVNATITLVKGTFIGMFTGWIFMLTLVVMLPRASLAMSFGLATLMALTLSALFVLRTKMVTNK